MIENKEREMYLTAIELIRNSGIKFTIEELCQKTRMSKKTFYTMFPSKGDFAIWTYRRIFSYYDDAVENLPIKAKFTSKEMFNLFNTFCNIMLASNEKTFNLYPMSDTIKEFAFKETQLRTKSFDRVLSNYVYKSKKNNSIVLYSIKSVLASISLDENYSKLLKEFLNLLGAIYCD